MHHSRLLLLPRNMSGSGVTCAQTLLEQFSWMEADKVAVMNTRNFGHSTAVTEQPMFCFETCIKLFYWSTAVYAFKEVCACLYALQIQGLQDLAV